ncbi:MAG: hypothetical protein MOGMAGMI_01476 [Candidatus Omnitrophica bacterium]|nr:hypothetical protein [Candidatus Omnitrophota bacterium]
MSGIGKEEYKDYLKEQYLTQREATEFLEISDEEMRSLIERKQVHAHNIAGAFSRFKKKELEAVKNRWRIGRELFPKPSETFAHEEAAPRASVWDHLADFWYFNDFYILCTLLIGALLYVILSWQ